MRYVCIFIATALLVFGASAAGASQEGPGRGHGSSTTNTNRNHNTAKANSRASSMGVGVGVGIGVGKGGRANVENEVSNDNRSSATGGRSHSNSSVEDSGNSESSSSVTGSGNSAQDQKQKQSQDQYAQTGAQTVGLNINEDYDYEAAAAAIGQVQAARCHKGSGGSWLGGSFGIGGYASECMANRVQDNWDRVRALYAAEAAAFRKAPYCDPEEEGCIFEPSPYLAEMIEAAALADRHFQRKLEPVPVLNVVPVIGPILNGVFSIPVRIADQF